MVDEVEETLVGPVQVVEDDDERALLGQRLEESAPGGIRLGSTVAAGRDRFCETDERTQVPPHPGCVGGRRQDLDDARLQLLLHHFFAVALEDAGLRLDHLAERPVSDSLPIGQAPPLAPVDEIRVGLDVGEELGHEAGLSDPGHADERHELGSLLLSGPREGVTEQVDLLLSPDQWTTRSPGQVYPHARASLERLPDLDRRRLALCLDRVVIAVRDRLCGGAIRRLVDEDAVHGRGALKPCRGIDDVAGGHALAFARPSAERNEGFARRDGDPELKILLLLHPVADRERGADRALGIVLVGDRSAEERHDRVPDELLDGAAVPLELAAQVRVVGLEHGAHILGIHLLGPARESDEVCEQHRHDLALLASIAGLRNERCAAGIAEAGLSPVLGTALRADDHHALAARSASPSRT